MLSKTMIVSYISQEISHYDFNASIYKASFPPQIVTLWFTWTPNRLNALLVPHCSSLSLPRLSHYDSHGRETVWMRLLFARLQRLFKQGETRDSSSQQKQQASSLPMRFVRQNLQNSTLLQLSHSNSRSGRKAVQVSGWLFTPKIIKLECHTR